MESLGLIMDLMDEAEFLNAMCHVTKGKEYELACNRLNDYYERLEVAEQF